MSTKLLTPGAQRLREYLRWIYRPIDRRDDPLPPLPEPLPEPVIQAITELVCADAKHYPKIVRCVCGLLSDSDRDRRDPACCLGGHPC
jgi:hypothetical protein